MSNIENYEIFPLIEEKWRGYSDRKNNEFD
jgi:hypothetical protein